MTDYVRVPREKLERWREYRNGGHGLAMYEAFEHILSEVDDLLAAAPQQQAEPIAEFVSVTDIESEIEHIRQNGINLAKFGGDNVDEGRCRELCASYLKEFITAKRMNNKLARLDSALRHPFSSEWNAAIEAAASFVASKGGIGPQVLAEKIRALRRQPDEPGEARENEERKK